MKNRSRAIVLTLVLMFILPSFLAYIAFNHSQWIGFGAVNKGKLLNPVLQLPAIKQTNKWHVFLVVADDCKRECFTQLDKLHRVRMSLGKDIYRTRQSLVSKEQSVNLVQLKHFDSSLIAVSDNELGDFAQSLPAIFIADPHANIILSYQADAKPDDIYSDLKRLLNVSKIG